jgi:hypothetical protein
MRLEAGKGRIVIVQWKETYSHRLSTSPHHHKLTAAHILDIPQLLVKPRNSE